jgi:molybdenum cofactor guanylyltransferase
LAGLNWAASLHPKAEALVTIPVDAPFFPLDLVERLHSAHTVTVAQSNGQLHPVFALWPLAITEELRDWLNAKNSRSVKDFLASIPHKAVDFQSADGFDPFTNINTPDDLIQAEMRIQKP